MRYVPHLAAAVGVEDVALLERDIRLHQMLHHLVLEADVRDDLVFKGGTCLIKCHLDYPRFSVDLDFTWRGPPQWATLGPQQARQATRAARHAWRRSLTETAKRLGYRFEEPEIEWGSSSRLATAFLRYASVTGEPATIKLQVNFVEPRVREDVTLDAHSLISRRPPLAAEILEGPGLDEYRAPFPVRCYDPEEIAAEKCRAILTRRAPKGRDVLDLFLLEEALGVDVWRLGDEIERKLGFALASAQRYRAGLQDAEHRFQALADQDIEGILLKPVDRNAFDAFRRRLLSHLATWLP